MARPVVRVRRSASSFIQAIISTSPVSYCWAIADTRPSAFHAIAAAGSVVGSAAGAVSTHRFFLIARAVARTPQCSAAGVGHHDFP